MTSLFGTPLVMNRETQWITADVQIQAPGSNACGVHVCGFFVGYASALLNGCLHSKVKSSQAATVLARMQIVWVSAQEWGQIGRRHILESLRSCSINLQNPLILFIQVSLNGDHA
jgi:hypothetical protein